MDLDLEAWKTDVSKAEETFKQAMTVDLKREELERRIAYETIFATGANINTLTKKTIKEVCLWMTFYNRIKTKV